MASTLYRGCLVALALVVTACAGPRVKTSSQKTIELNSTAQSDSRVDVPRAAIQEAEVSSEDVERNAEKPYVSAYGEIPFDDNEHVQKWINYFQTRGRDKMELYLSRSTRYLPMMKNVLRENGLPEDLVYIALIESGFSPRAHSRANAVGYWQFIRSTGRRFGMQVDTLIDERRDPVLSTRAAAEYFKALYSLLGSWHLAMASYNVGEGRVKRAVSRYGTKDFWTLIKKRRSLPAETKNYIPKFIAAARIAKDPVRYGFSNVKYEDPLSYDTVALTSSISMSKLASNINVDREELQLLNPKFRTDYVPLSSRGTQTVVRIPVGRGTDAMAALSMSVSSAPRILQAEYSFYRIRRGDTLSTVARRHRTTVSQLRRLNGLSNRTLLRVGRTLKVPDNGGDSVRPAAVEEDAQSSRARGRNGTGAGRQLASIHVVRRGENLSTIARRYGLTVGDLLKMNELSRRSTLRRGQKLKVRATVASNKVSRHHRVRRGETLTDLSNKYGISISRLARANKVKANYRVIAGEKLVIPASAIPD